MKFDPKVEIEAKVAWIDRKKKKEKKGKRETEQKVEKLT